MRTDSRSPLKRKPAHFASPHHVTVADGRTAVGTVDLVDGRYRATDSKGRVVGAFSTIREASRAFDRRAR
jgi:hypothetical protein